MEEFKRLSYEDKLLVALNHPVPERRMMAAQILGNMRSQRALNEFLKIVTSGNTDYYFLRAVLLATAKINHPDRQLILQKASQHYSTLISNFAIELIEQLEENGSVDEWDRHTG
ncbi:MAG: HEAT repeat domain-containing protein [Anaerolineae bacterium]|nr:HEAT repeat domain-containing protein [Anaerolineae bacterium]